MYFPASPEAAASKKTVSTPEIVLIAIVAITVIIITSIFVALMLNTVSSSRENIANQTNVSNFSFRVYEGKTQTKVVAPDLTGKPGLTRVSDAAMLGNNRLLQPALS